MMAGWNGATANGREGRPRLLIVGGPDVNLRIDLMTALADRYDVLAAGSDPGLEGAFTRAGFAYHHYPLGRGVNPGHEIRSVLTLESLFRRLEPDIVHTFATKPGVWGRIAARRAGVPAVIGTLPGLGSLYSSANGWSHRISRRIYERLQRYASDGSHMTVFQNEDDLSRFREAGIVTEDRSTVVPGSGVATHFFDRERVSEAACARVRTELGLGPDSLVVTMVSRVMRTKGVMEFAHVAGALRARRPNVEFVLVGPDDQGSIDRLSGPERDRLNASVRWLGHRSDIRDILAISHTFALPTYYREGMPRSLLEAASMSLPLIATSVPGCEDVVVPGECGFLVPPRDPSALEQAVEALMADAELRCRMGSAARQRVLEHFDLSVIAERTASLYEEILRTPRVPAGNVPDGRSEAIAGGHGSPFPSTRFTA